MKLITVFVHIIVVRSIRAGELINSDSEVCDVISSLTASSGREDVKADTQNNIDDNDTVDGAANSNLLSTFLKAALSDGTLGKIFSKNNGSTKNTKNIHDRKDIDDVDDDSTDGEVNSNLMSTLLTAVLSGGLDNMFSEIIGATGNLSSIHDDDDINYTDGIKDTSVINDTDDSPDVAANSYLSTFLKAALSDGSLGKIFSKISGATGNSKDNHDGKDIDDVGDDLKDSEANSNLMSTLLGVVLSGGLNNIFGEFIGATGNLNSIHDDDINYTDANTSVINDTDDIGYTDNLSNEAANSNLLSTFLKAALSDGTIGKIFSKISGAMGNSKNIHDGKDIDDVGDDSKDSEANSNLMSTLLGVVLSGGLDNIFGEFIGATGKINSIHDDDINYSDDIDDTSVINDTDDITDNLPNGAANSNLLSTFLKAALSDGTLGKIFSKISGSTKNSKNIHDRKDIDDVDDDSTDGEVNSNLMSTLLSAVLSGGSDNMFSEIIGATGNLSSIHDDDDINYTDDIKDTSVTNDTDDSPDVAANSNLSTFLKAALSDGTLGKIFSKISGATGNSKDNHDEKDIDDVGDVLTNGEANSNLMSTLLSAFLSGGLGNIFGEVIDVTGNLSRIHNNDTSVINDTDIGYTDDSPDENIDGDSSDGEASNFMSTLLSAALSGDIEKMSGKIIGGTGDFTNIYDFDDIDGNSCPASDNCYVADNVGTNFMCNTLAQPRLYFNQSLGD